MRVKGTILRTAAPAASALLLIIAGCARVPSDVDTTFAVCTWTEEDTSTTLAVNFSIGPDAKEALLLYDTEARAGEPDAYRSRAKGRRIKVSGLSGFAMFQAELSGLEPATSYYFVVGHPGQGYGEERKVRTLPSDDRPLRLVAGGDIGVGEDAAPFLQAAAALDPDFALIGGDIAYGNGKVKHWDRWIDWFQLWDRHMVRTDGHAIPFAAAPGNHEVEIDFGYRKAPFFKHMLDQDRAPYFLRHFGSDLDVYLLDSDHLVRRGGRQAAWLEAKLEENNDRAIKFVMYHEAIFPCGVREDPAFTLSEGKRWLPLFDRYRIHTAFEHHCHALKRTHPITRGRVAKDGEWGTLYLGDGGWGMPVRAVDTNRWYIAHAETAKHFWFVDIGPEEIAYRAVGIDGGTLDETTRPRAPGGGGITKAEVPGSE